MFINFYSLENKGILPNPPIESLMFASSRTKKQDTLTPEEEEKRQLLDHRMNHFVLPADNNDKFRVPSLDDYKDVYPFIDLLTTQGFNPQVYRLPDESLAIYVPRYVSLEEELVLVQQLETLDLSHFLWGRPTRRLFTYIDKNPPPVLPVEEQPVKNKYYVRGKNKGKLKPAPRKKHPKQKFPEALLTVATRLEPIAGLPLNKALINKYRKAKYFTQKGEWTQGAGKDNMPPHRDSECIFGKGKPIVSVSLGQSRRFLIQHIATELALEFHLGHGDLLLMTPTLNEHCVHWIPNQVNLEMMSDRWNVTFRSVKGQM
jgi:alkylated DNA repair dioxygenase AlkB